MSRRRWVYREDVAGNVEAVEVSPDYERHDERPPVFTDRYMEGIRAPDGTDIGCRWKRAEYMRREGVADLSDYRETLARQQQQREDWRQGKAPVSRETVNEIGRIAHELSSKRGRR